MRSHSKCTVPSASLLCLELNSLDVMLKKNMKNAIQLGLADRKKNSIQDKTVVYTIIQFYVSEVFWKSNIFFTLKDIGTITICTHMSLVPMSKIIFVVWTTTKSSGSTPFVQGKWSSTCSLFFVQLKLSFGDNKTLWFPYYQVRSVCHNTNNIFVETKQISC